MSAVRAVEGWVCKYLAVVAMAVVLGAFAVCPAPAVGQTPDNISRDDVGWIYARARFAKEFTAMIAREGPLGALGAADRQPVLSDTLLDWVWTQAAWALSAAPDNSWAGEVYSWKVIPPGQRLRHSTWFKQTRMAYVGNDNYTMLDTTATPQLRAKMQHAYGDPTETIVEASRLGPPSEYIQFEYWFVVNDTIPVIVMDAGGPSDHGVVLAGDHRFREHLYAVRQSLLGSTMRDVPPAVYVDYFFDTVEERWYRTGFDGAEYFATPIREPRLTIGRPTVSASVASTPVVRETRDTISREEVGAMDTRGRVVEESDVFVVREGPLRSFGAVDRQPVSSDTLLGWVQTQSAWAFPPAAELIPWTGEVRSWVVIPPDQRLRHKAWFTQTQMVYVGNEHGTMLDTTPTSELRGRMQSAYGDPTATIVEASRLGPPAEYIQFEYWFAVNDTIPIIVKDAGGPSGHGLVVAGDHRIREHLYTVRQSLLESAMQEALPAPYVDYFFDTVQERWYRTGFDGSKYFMQPIRDPRLSRGRPVLSASEL